MKLDDYQKAILIMLYSIFTLSAIGFGSIVFLAIIGRSPKVDIVIFIMYIIYLFFVVTKFRKFKKGIKKWIKELNSYYL